MELENKICEGQLREVGLLVQRRLRGAYCALSDGAAARWAPVSFVR